MTTDRYKKRIIGLTHDQRAQLWSLTCPKCQTKFTPRSTLLAKQYVCCPNERKCDYKQTVDYNLDGDAT